MSRNPSRCSPGASRSATMSAVQLRIRPGGVVQRSSTASAARWVSGMTARPSTRICGAVSPVLGSGQTPPSHPSGGIQDGTSCEEAYAMCCVMRSYGTDGSEPNAAFLGMRPADLVFGLRDRDHTGVRIGRTSAVADSRVPRHEGAGRWLVDFFPEHIATASSSLRCCIQGVELDCRNGHRGCHILGYFTGLNLQRYGKTMCCKIGTDVASNYF